LHIEKLESRDLLSNIIQIDANMIQQANGGPIYLTQANTQYVLTQDIDVTGAAFVAGAANVTLDLGGHTVTFGDSSPIQVSNGGFEQGSGRNLPGWDLSAAPTASQVPSIPGMWGQWMLQLSNFTSTQTIWSAAVAIPTANREYAAAITPKGTYGSTVTLSVVDAVTGAVLATGTSSQPDRGFSAVATFTPTTTDAVKLRVDVTPPSGQSATMALDYAAIMPSRDFGVVATQMWTGNLPAQLVTSQFQQVYKNAANFTIQNGHLIQGGAHGYASNPLYFDALVGFTVNNVDTLTTGMDTNNLDANWGQNALVENSTFRGAVDRISNRMNIYAAINLANFDGTASVTGNQIVGVPQVGVMVNAADTNEQSVAINNNTIRQQSIVTDGYGVLVSGIQNFQIAYNQILPTNGRGILIDGWGKIPTQNGAIHDNYVSVMEGPNLEYAWNNLEATALRLRNWNSTQRHLTFSKNTFIATTGPGYVYDAIAGRISDYNDRGQETNADKYFQNNVFQAIVTTADPNYGAQALSISGVDAGTGLKFSRNVLLSNDTSLAIGDRDSYGRHNDDISFLSTTFQLATAGAHKTYAAIVAGNWNNEVSNIRMYYSRLASGASMNVVYMGSAHPGCILFQKPKYPGGQAGLDWQKAASNWVFSTANKDGKQGMAGTPVAMATAASEDRASVFSDGLTTGWPVQQRRANGAAVIDFVWRIRGA
jgi:hypothetical protein